MIWKDSVHGLEVEATCKTDAVIKINKILIQLRLKIIGLSHVYQI